MKLFLNFAELQSVFSHVANIANDRMPFLKEVSEGVPIVPITVLLVLGKILTAQLEERCTLYKVGYIRLCWLYAIHLLDAWYTNWELLGFASLLP